MGPAMERIAHAALIGSPGRLRALYGAVCQPFELRSIWDETFDTLISVRAWDHVAPLVSMARARPMRLVQVADGLVFARNVEKPVNSRACRMFNQPWWDRVIFAQPLHSVKYAPPGAVTALDFRSCAKSVSSWERVIFVFGNDPFLGLSHSDLRDEIWSVMSFHARVCGIREFLYSAPTGSRVAKWMNAFGAAPVGPMSAFQSPANSLFVGTPSTALYERFLSGESCVVLESFKESWLSNIFSFHGVIESGGCRGALIKFPENITRFGLASLLDFPCKVMHKTSGVFACFRAREFLKQVYDICIQK